MTVEELKSLMDKVLTMLNQNKALVTESYLGELRSLSSKTRDSGLYRRALGGAMDVDSEGVIAFLDTTDGLVGLEEQLLSLTEEIVNILSNLETRPLIMDTIAAVSSPGF